MSKSERETKEPYKHGCNQKERKKEKKTGHNGAQVLKAKKTPVRQDAENNSAGTSNI